MPEDNNGNKRAVEQPGDYCATYCIIGERSAEATEVVTRPQLSVFEQLQAASVENTQKRQLKGAQRRHLVGNGDTKPTADMPNSIKKLYLQFM